MNWPARTARAAGQRLARAFSMVELLIALTISSMLLTACLVALDGTFKSYERTADSASTHVVARLVMYRMLGMIRQGTEFAPFPPDVIATPRVERDWIQFVSFEDPTNPARRDITTIRREADPDTPGTFRLSYVRESFGGGTVAPETGVLIRNLRDAVFTLEFDTGPRLIRATIDLTILPDDVESNVALSTDLPERTLRLVASTSPRRLDQ